MLVHIYVYIGNVLKGKGYDVNYIYGGNSFFDNMGKFFSSNGYTVLDKRDIPDSFIQTLSRLGVLMMKLHLIILYNNVITVLTRASCFFNHMMTISNHRPYTFPQRKR